jgi:hypothetical protein
MLKNWLIGEFIEIVLPFRKTHMFGVEGQHTFFIPVDSAFDVSVHISGYDYERTRLKNDPSSNRGVLYSRGSPVSTIIWIFL